MTLFESYMNGSVVWCDQTEIETFPEPSSRIRCTQINNQCGIDCSDLIIENGLVLCNLDQSWNCNLCGNDIPFWIPFELGDTIDFQFQQIDYFGTPFCEHGWLPTDLLSPTNTAFASFEIRSCCDSAPLGVNEFIFNEIVAEHYVGSYNIIDYSGNTITNSIQQIRFNLSKISEYMVLQNLDPCFYIVFNFIGTYECLPNTDTINTFYSEPFKALACRDKTHLVESTYPSLDCFDFYYGSNFNTGRGVPFQYSNKIRIPSWFENTNFTITKESIGATLKTTASQYCETWAMRTAQLPYKFIKYLVNLFSGKNVYVDGIEYQIQGDISKNNDIGSQWLLEASFERCECSKSLSCE